LCGGEDVEEQKNDQATGGGERKTGSTKNVRLYEGEGGQKKKEEKDRIDETTTT